MRQYLFMKSYKNFVVLFVVSFVFIACAKGQTTYYKVIHVADGDTFTILNNNVQQKIRVQGIDAPEKKMPFGNVSKMYLSNLCFNKEVSIKYVTTDRYGRTVAWAKLRDGRDISTEMVKAGMAWHYLKYSSDKNLSMVERRARKLRLGLWQDKNPEAPWEYRKYKRKIHSQKRQLQKRY